MIYNYYLLMIGGDYHLFENVSVTGEELGVPFETFEEAQEYLDVNDITLKTSEDDRI